MTTTPYTAVTPEAVVPQPAATGDVVGVVLQDAGLAALPAQEVSFGEVFLPGQLAAGAGLVAVVGGVREAAQVDARTFNADGSVATAEITMAQPALDAGASVGVMLAVADAADPASAPAIDLAAATAGHALSVQLTLQNADGSTMPLTVDVLAALRAALAGGTASYWQQGPLATQARVDIPVSGSLHLVADVTATADGALQATIGFDNDLAMGTGGGAITYDASVTLDGATTTVATALTQYQYEDWHATVSTDGTATANVQHDVMALERTGAVADYDTSVGVSADWMDGEATAVAAPGWDAPLATNGVEQGMPSTGGRADIGPTTQGNAAWLLTQDATAQAFALGQADAAAGIPWHFAYEGGWLNTSYASDLWTDPRSGQYNTGLTQQVSGTNNGWTTDQSHQPDLSYDAYLLTGNRVYLDDLNAQASYDVTQEWPGEYSTGSDGTVTGNGRITGGVYDNVINDSPVRGAAWNMRQIDEAAWANPAGSAEGAYFTQVAADNWQWLVAQLPAWGAEEGQSYGWLPQGNNVGNFPAWQQDYFASTAIAAAEHGNADAITYLKWAQNFLVGRFLHAADGFDPNNGVTYQLFYQNDGTQVTPTSWAQLQADTAANGNDNGTGWSHSEGVYAMLGLETLAGYVSVLGSTDAMRAYGWLLASGAPYIDTASLQDNSQFAVAPRLSDGELLTRDEITLANDSTATTLSTSGINALVYESGGGDVTIQGGATINVLFAGTGSDVLLGGAGADSLFGGMGSVTLSGGAGTNVMETGTGAATILLSATDIASDTIIGFRPGTDTLLLRGTDGQPIDASEAAALAAAASSDAAGDAVVALSPSHAVTLTGIGLSQLGAVLGANAVADPAAPSVPGGAGQGTGTGSTATTITAPGGSGGTDPTAVPGGSDGSGSVATSGMTTIATISTFTLSVGEMHVELTGSQPVTVYGASMPSQVVIADHGGLTYLAQGGSGIIQAGLVDAAAGGSVITLPGFGFGTFDVSMGAGNDTINAITGNDTIAAGLGTNQITLGSGSCSVLTTGQDDIVGGSGPATISASSGGVLCLGGSGALAFVGGGDESLVVGTTGDLSLTGGAAGSSLVAFGGTGTLLFTGGAGAATIVGGQGATTLTGGSGGGALYASANGDNLLTATAANTALVGQGALDRLVASGAGGDFLAAGAGNETLDGSLSQGGNLYFGGTGADTVMTGAGPDEVIGGSGHLSVLLGKGGSLIFTGVGADTISAAAGHTGGSTTVVGFRIGTDHLQLTGYTQAPNVATVPGGSVLSFADGTSITLSGVTATSIATLLG